MLLLLIKDVPLHFPQPLTDIIMNFAPTVPKLHLHTQQSCDQLTMTQMFNGDHIT